MPHIRIRGVSEKTVQEFSQGLNEELARLIQTTPDNFTIELIASQYFEQGKAISSYPFIEVLWFERTQEIKGQVAKFMTEKMRALLGAVDVAVIFVPIEKTN